MIDFNFTKSDVIEELKRLQQVFKTARQINYCTTGGKITAKPTKPFENLFAKSLSPIKKDELSRMLAAVTADSRNMLSEAQLWSPERRLLMYSTADNGICTQSEMDAVLELKSTDRYISYLSLYSRLNIRYVDPSPLVTWVEYNRISSRGELMDNTRTIYGALTYRWQLVLFDYLHQDVQLPFPPVIDADIAAGNFTHVNLQDRIANALTYLVQAYRADVITPGVTRIMSKSDIKKVKVAQLDMNPFAEGPYNQLLDGYFAQSLATHFLNAVTASLVPYKGRTMPDGMKVMDKIVQNTDALDNIQLIELILPHLSGFKASALNKFNEKAYVFKIKELLKSHGNNWLDVQIFKHKVYRHAIAVERSLIMPFGIESAELLSTMTNRMVTAATQNNDVMYPFIEGFLVQLMAMGVLEGVFAPFEKNMNSYFGGLRYVRLTELGQKLFGFGNSFALTLVDKYVGQYDLVDGPLLVYSRLEDNPNDNLLSDIAVKTGRYWKVTTESFLRNCESANGIRQNIDQFKQSICKNPPAAWQQFFDGLVTKAESGPTKDSTSWCIMDIAPDNAELQRLLCTDQFRDIVFRAEGYRILIKKSDYTTFTKLMKQHGYLIP